MKKNLFITIPIVFFALAILAACNKEKEEYDVKGCLVPKIFFSLLDQAEHTELWRMTTIDDIVKCKSWPARRTIKDNKICKVTVGIDNSLIKAYNAKHKTSYKPFPAGTLVLANATATINADQCISTDSIKISVNTKDLPLDTCYMTVIRIIGVTPGSIVSDLDSVCVKVSIHERTNCYDNPKAKDMNGSPVADRSKWTTTTTVSVAGGDINSIFQANRSGWRSPNVNLPFDLTVDMKSKIDNIEGVRLKCLWSISTYRLYSGPTSAKVFTSDDGETWTLQGMPSIAYNDDDQTSYIKFYTHISTRFIKLNVTSRRNENGNIWNIYFTQWDTFVVN